ncbi:hypothetical protein G7Y89_g15240 [Cudoniella acicularis]|uniref:Kinesin light chain n=1 Tax=Cudoniella acicularis TaxID=354080 RepID=A0A8H4QS57_9HELO|nr:hypothetical protein G7Y89_g15240 [Cudoniella acicularis]
MTNHVGRDNQLLCALRTSTNRERRYCTGPHEQGDLENVPTACTVEKKALGEEHPSTLTSMANLASTYRNQGRWDEAEELEVQVMETRKTKLGADHPDKFAFTWKGHG